MTAAVATRVRLLAPAVCVPFAVVALVHLAAKAAGAVDLDHWTKPLLMPALAIPAVVLGRRGPLAPTAALLAGILLSWLGDVTVENLIVGLSFFLVAHVAYLIAFGLAFSRRVPVWAAVYAVWWVALMAVLAPWLGGMLIPVGVYGLALGAMAAVATRGTALTTIGGALFVASDSLLAVRLFTPGMQGVLADVVIMGLYLAAQALLVAGVLRRRLEPRG